MEFVAESIGLKFDRWYFFFPFVVKDTNVVFRRFSWGWRHKNFGSWAARQKETTYVIFVGFGYYFLVGSLLRLQNCWPLTPFASTYYFWVNRPPWSRLSVINKSNGFGVPFFFLVGTRHVFVFVRSRCDYYGNLLLKRRLQDEVYILIRMTNIFVSVSLHRFMLWILTSCGPTVRSPYVFLIKKYIWWLQSSFIILIIL